MAQRVNYSTNPRSYSQLLASGISARQIREAINSGLDPSQLPPEYFGKASGNYTPQSVGPGATPNPNIGGVDIPPANMADPYGYTPSGGPGSSGVFGTTSNMGFPSNFDLGGYLPSSTTDYLGIPGSTTGNLTQNLGGPMDLAGYGGMTGGGWDLYGGMDWGYVPSYGDYQSYPTDYGSMNWGGNDISNFGSDPGAFAGYLPPSTDAYLGFGGTDTGGGGISMPQDFSQTPGDVFAGVQDPVETFSEPGALPSDVPAPDDWVDGLPPMTPPPDIPDVPEDQPAPQDQPSTTPDGTALPDNYGYAPPPEALPPGMMPGFELGVFSPTGPFSTPGLGPMFSSNNTSNLFGGLVQLPNGAIVQRGMFGLGAMNAPGGSMPVGFSNPTGIDVRSPGETPDVWSVKLGNEAAKSGMSTDDYEAMLQSLPSGPTGLEQKALANPLKFWSSRIAQSRRMMSGGSQPSGPILSGPLDNMAFSGAGSYRGWSFNPATGNFEAPPPTAKTSKGTK